MDTLAAVSAVERDLNGYVLSIYGVTYVAVVSADKHKVCLPMLGHGSKRPCKVIEVSSQERDLEV